MSTGTLWKKVFIASSTELVSKGDAKAAAVFPMLPASGQRKT